MTHLHCYHCDAERSDVAPREVRSAATGSYVTRVRLCDLCAGKHAARLGSMIPALVLAPEDKDAEDVRAALACDEAAAIEAANLEDQDDDAPSYRDFPRDDLPSDEQLHEDEDRARDGLPQSCAARPFSPATDAPAGALNPEARR